MEDLDGCSAGIGEGDDLFDPSSICFGERKLLDLGAVLFECFLNAAQCGVVGDLPTDVDDLVALTLDDDDASSTLVES